MKNSRTGIALAEALSESGKSLGDTANQSDAYRDSDMWRFAAIGPLQVDATILYRHTTPKLSGSIAGNFSHYQLAGSVRW